MKIFRFHISEFLFFIILVISSCTVADTNDQIIIHKDKESDYFKQLSIINTAVRENLDKPIYYYKRAYFFQKNNKLNQGVKDIETAIQLDSTNASYYYLYGQILQGQKEYTAALEATQKAIRMGINDFPIYVLAAELYYRNQQPSEAQRYLRLAEAFGITVPELQYWKARLALDRRDTTEGFPILRNMIKEDSTHKESWLAIVDYYDTIGDLDKSIDLLTKATSYIELDASSLHRIALRYDSLYGLDSSFVWYEQAAQLPGTNFDINFKCAKYHIQQKEYDKAIPYYEKALLQNSEYDFGFYQLGYIYEVYQKELDEALDNYQEAFNLKKDTIYLYALNRVKRKIAAREQSEEN